MLTKYVQNTLHKVIAAKFYDRAYVEYENGSSFMCFSLKYAYDRKVIGWLRYTVTLRAVQGYVRRLAKYKGYTGAVTLQYALLLNDLPYDITARGVIYMDWANRPKPWSN